MQASERCVQDRARRISVLQGELDAAHQQISANREMNENAEKQLKQFKEKWQVSQAELKQITEEMEEEKENVSKKVQGKRDGMFHVLLFF